MNDFNNNYSNDFNSQSTNQFDGGGAPNGSYQPNGRSQAPTILVTESAKELRSLARIALNGLWWKAFLGVLIYELLLVGVPTLFDLLFPATRVSYTYYFNELSAEFSDLGISPEYKISISTIQYVYQFLLAGPFMIGLLSFIFSIVRRREVAYPKLFDGFQIFLKAFLLQFLIALLTALWTIPVVMVGTLITVFMPILSLLPMIGATAVAFWAYLRYSMASFYLADNHLLGVMECINLSKSSMKGNKGALFGLLISFIGWAFLAAIPESLLMAGFQNSNEAFTAVLGFIANSPRYLVMLYFYTAETFFFEILSGKLSRQQPAPMYF